MSQRARLFPYSHFLGVGCPSGKRSQCKLMPFNGQGLSASSALSSSAARSSGTGRKPYITPEHILVMPQWCSEEP